MKNRSVGIRDPGFAASLLLAGLEVLRDGTAVLRVSFLWVL